MSERFEVKAGEHGLIRLFALDDQEADHESLTAPPSLADETLSPLQEALGARYIDSDFVEVFDVADLEGLGLTGYMVEGLGIAQADVEEDRARLEALAGKVVVILSQAFGDFAQTLTPKPPLRWIGTYSEERAAVKFEPLPAASAQRDKPAEPKKRPSDAAMSGRVAMVALLVIFALTAVMVWIA